jgi:hypothetical protein
VKRSIALLLLGPLALLAPRARADEMPAWIIKEGPRPATVAIELNPLAIAVGRFSATLEYVMQTHHVAALSPHYYWAFPAQADTFDGGGVELGYRYYTGRRGPDGFFLGASFLFGDYRYKHSVETLTALDGHVIDQSNETDFQSYGGAIDAGYKLIVGDSFIVGVGGGLQYRAFTLQPSFTSNTREDAVYGSGLRPRMLVETGGVF